MPIRPSGKPVSEVTPSATPGTLSNMAAQVALGPIDERTALMIKFCEASAEAKFQPELSESKTQLAVLNERFDNTLRELRDRLDTLRLDDILKVIIGIFGGFLVRAFSDKGVEAIKDTWVGFSGVGFVVSLVVLLIRYVSPSARKKEITEELRQRRKV